MQERLRSIQNEQEAKCIGFYFETGDGVLHGAVKENVDEILGDGWDLSQLDEDGAEYEVVNKASDLSGQDAWDKSYSFKSVDGFAVVEPIFEMTVNDSLASDEEQRNIISQLPGLEDIAQEVQDIVAPLADWALSVVDNVLTAGEVGETSTDNAEWVIDFLKVSNVWEKYFQDKGVLPGHGIVVGLPDTGITEHPMVIDKVDLSPGHDFVDDDKDQTDPMDRPTGEVVHNPGHGTLTASMIVGASDNHGDEEDGEKVVGIAPGVDLVPLRVTSSVVIFNTYYLSKAIEYAADKGFHIVSISLGCGFPSTRLKRAIRYAQSKGVIIVAAAGTFTPFVVYPAAFEAVIGIGGCTAERKMWIGSPRGQSIDVVAPSDSVWLARAKKEDNRVKYFIEKGTGTSLSTPIVAGVAALWLAHHGRDNLIEKYGAENLPFVFKKLLCDTCDTPEDWNTKIHGAGIVDAEKLLETELPDSVDRSAPFFSESDELLTRISNYLGADPKDDEAAAKIKLFLSKLFDASDEDFEEKLVENGPEFCFHLSCNQNRLGAYLSELVQSLE